MSKIFEIPLGNKASNVKIPSKILESNNEVLSTFLRAYFDCDGYTPKNKRDIEIATASKIMSEHLRLALLRFGIVCFTKTKYINGKPYYRILIRGNFVNKFAKKIGFQHSFKKIRLEEISKRNWLLNTNVDVITLV